MIIDETNSIYLSSNESYARIIDGDTRWITTNTPTPNSSNKFNSGVYNSHPSGFYDNSFQLELIKLNNNQKIYIFRNIKNNNNSEPCKISENIKEHCARHCGFCGIGQ